VADSHRLPAFTGLVVHRDPSFGYSLLIPDGWHRLETEGGGALYVPDRDEPLTGLGVEARNLGTDVRPADLPALRSGFLAGLRQLPGCRIERRKAEAVGPLITLEARHTYLEDGTVRKRWTRLLYQKRTQVRLIAQAATIERFDYWEPMFFQAMRTVRFGDWWAAALGVEWAERPFADE
jgi:hypothetical protein